MPDPDPTYEFMAPARQPGYDAVWAIIRNNPQPWTAHDYAVLWRAVEAYGDAMGLPE